MSDDAQILRLRDAANVLTLGDSTNVLTLRARTNVLLLPPVEMEAGATPPPGPTILFYDTFTGANGTAISARAPDIDTVGGGWVDVKLVSTASAANNTIQSNRGRVGVNVTGAVANVGVADVRVRMDHIVGTALIPIRYSSEGNMFALSVNPGSATNNVSLREYTADALQTRAVTSYAITLPIEIIIEANGETITATITGGPTISYNAAAQYKAETRFGIGRTASNCDFDDFEVKTL